MSKRIVDPSKFLLMGGVIDWRRTYQAMTRALIAAGASSSTLDIKKLLPFPDDIAKERRLQKGRVVQLRWLTHKDFGMPSEPFKVWRRPAQPFKTEEAFTPSQMPFMLGTKMVMLTPPRKAVTFTMTTTNPSGGAVIAFAGAPFGSTIVGGHTLSSAGSTQVHLTSSQIACLLCPQDMDLDNFTGLGGEPQDDDSWELVEIVGLPVDQSFNGVGGWGQDQGLVSQLSDPVSAALDRFRRGAPFYGWMPMINASLPAEPWKLAQPKPIIELFQKQMMEPLRDMMQTLVPSEHQLKEISHTLAMAQAGGPDARAHIKPLSTVLFGAGTDPLASLILGYGTAFEDEPAPIDHPGINITHVAAAVSTTDSRRSGWDYMVTGLWEKGLDGKSAPVEYAALLLHPELAMNPPAPTGLQTKNEGLTSPASLDQPYQSVARVTWNKPSEMLPVRVASYAFMRAGIAPVSAVEPLMDKRFSDSALQPISATSSTTSPEPNRLAALDDRYIIASDPNPNQVTYALAHQDLLGLWSPWNTTNMSMGEPPVRPVSIVSARVETVPAVSGNCPGKLIVELVWDWVSRSPERIELVGRLYPQTKLGAGPSDLSVPAGLSIQLGDMGATVTSLNFNGNPTAVANPNRAQLSAVVEYVDFDGKTLLLTPPTPPGPRRYRLTITGLSLNFNTAPLIGLALWARAIEHRAPHRAGPWNANPTIASMADPRPPVIAVEHEDVQMASMADAAGLHHAKLSWPAVPGAVGYFAYTVTEEKLRADRGLPSAAKSLTLSQRLSALRDAFAANPDRRSFARVNAKPVTGTSMQVSLPKGSKEIHLYMIIAVNAGNIESEWPTLSDTKLRKRPVAFAAPQVVKPSPPDLEVSRVLDQSVTPPTYKAELKIRTKAGPLVSRVDIHRVRVPEASLDIDMMGPPLVTLSGSGSGYTVKAWPLTGPLEPGEFQTIGTIKGQDAVQGSWKKVFYRVAAWAADDPTRGLYGSRSAASAIREVVIPPATPPDLSTPVVQPPGGNPLQSVIELITTAPVLETPMGPHRFRVDVIAEAPDGTSTPVFSHPSAGANAQADRLEALGTSAPAANTSGVWRANGATSGQTKLMLQIVRATAQTRLKIRWMLTDPLGRSTEKLLTLDPVTIPALPAPDIVGLNASIKAGAGWTVLFNTSSPVSAAPDQAYELTISYRANSVIRPGGLGGPIIARPISVTTTLAAIKKFLPGEDLFKDLAVIPVRRMAAGGGLNNIRFVIKSKTNTPGKVTVTIKSPNGQTATSNITLS